MKSVFIISFILLISSNAISMTIKVVEHALFGDTSVYLSSSPVLSDITVTKVFSQGLADYSIQIKRSSCISADKRVYISAANLFSNKSVYFSESPLFADVKIYVTASTLIADHVVCADPSVSDIEAIAAFAGIIY